ncbi:MULTISPECIES: sensor domain-containing diguanylate cyclase [Pseudomonas]|uniref:sensor domain-containing diguanylate cyclase n=1 Tax=Pseudomonas TaxID=286 RepID=UPI00244BDBE1|nr:MULTISPECIES: sensor domain-containing diguanylate cyclase [Pseudomonas]MDH1548444.1 sensor domain-containing diguanylate cyclase [Pseudomonas juntendi]
MERVSGTASTDGQSPRKVDRLHLRWLILIFVMVSVLATLANSLITAYRVQQDALIEHALESNRAYAAKVASSIGEFLQSAHSHLRFSADELGKHWGNAEVLRAEAIRLQRQDTDFNSIAIIDATGRIKEAYPDRMQIKGSTPHSPVADEFLAARRPVVSSAYMSAAGNLVVMISQPIFGPSGEYLGVIGGSVYLQKQSALHTLISRHFHHEGTFAFVADSQRQLLSHPEEQRIGEKLGWSKTVDAALRGESGSMAVENYKGVPMLAGYAQVPDADWAVVAQQPREISLAPLKVLMRDMVLGMIPASLLGLLMIWFGAVLISRPLQQLSKIAAQLSASDATERLKGIRTWYSDAAAIRRAMLVGVELLQVKIGRLNEEARTDPLTGLANRRVMTDSLARLDASLRNYCVLALDIDFFKKVNDTYGHDIGDVALKHVAEILRISSRANDLVCRAGGEEFTVVLPDTDIEAARVIAERIRQSIANHPVPGVGSMTVSIGVAGNGRGKPCSQTLLKHADEYLYEAKHSGRNRVCSGVVELTSDQ